MSATPTPSRPEDELLEQWSFLDSMVERQAEALRAGTQDVEETEPLPSGDAGVGELAQLRSRVDLLEREATALRAQLEGRDRELQRAQQHSAELMRSLRDAHAAVEDSHQAMLAAERRAAEAGAAAERRTAEAGAAAARPQSPPAADAPPPAEWSERPRRSAIFANQDPPPPPPKPSLLDRLLGRR